MGFLGRALGFTHIGDIPVPKRVSRTAHKVKGDIGEDLRGIVPLISMAAKAGAHDAPVLVPGAQIPHLATNLIRGDSVTHGFHRPNALLNLGAQALVGNVGYQARALGEDPKDAPIIMGRDGKLYRNSRGGGLAYLLAPLLPDVPKSVLEDARSEKRGRALFGEDPLNAPLAFLPSVGAAGRVVTVGKLAKNIERANNASKAHVFDRAKALKVAEGLTSKEALAKAKATMPTMSPKLARRIAKKEITSPGYAARHGLEGGIPDRIIKGQYGEAPGRMRSRSSMGRGMQGIWDLASEKIDASDRRGLGPESRWSSSTRVQAAEARAVSRQTKRHENAITDAEINLKKALGRRFWQTANDAPLTETQQDVMNGLIVALEHGDLSPEEAIKARIALHEAVLSGGVSSAMSEDEIAKLGTQLEGQMTDLTDHQHGVIAAYANDLRRAQMQADVAEAQATRLAQRRTPEETQIIRERLRLNPHVKRSEAEFVKINESLAKLKAEHEALVTKIEDLLTDPNSPPSKRNRDLSRKTKQLQATAAKLSAKRLEFRDALAWGHDVSDEVRRTDLGVAHAEAKAEDALHGARRTQYDRERRVQIREHRLADREESANALLEDERKALDKAFDDMVANPRKSTPLTEVERHLVEAQMASLRRALDHPRSEVEYRRAVAGMRTLAEWADETGRRIAKMGKTPEEQAAVDLEFDSRQNRVGEEMVRRGILTQEQAQGAYFPHYSMWSNAGKEVGRGHGVSGPIVDGPNLNDYILNHNENDLQLLQRGMVDMSPTTMGNLLRNRLRWLSTQEAVQKLYREGDAVPEGVIGRGWSLVRNPDAAKTKASDRLHMAITDPERYQRNIAMEEAPTPVSDAADAGADLTRAQQRALAHKSAEEARLRENAGSSDPDGTAAEMKNDLDEAVYHVGEGPAPDWVKQTKNYRLVPTKVAKARLGEAIMKSPDSDALAWVNSVNMVLRSMILYTPYAGTRYVARNAVQNATLLALTHPGAFRHLTDSVKMVLGSADDRARYRRIAVEGGTVSASAGLPEATTSYLSRAKSTERKMAGISGKTANVLGDFADEPFRVAAWINYARRYDFKTPEQWDELISNPKHAKLRDEISQRVREDLLDFDTATPMERNVLNRILFLYPFMRASAKWPFMFAREYPVRTAIAGTLAHEAPVDQTYEGVPQSVQESSSVDGRNWSIWDPTGPLRTQVENVQAAIGTMRHDQGAQSLADNVHPFLGIGMDIANGNPVGDSLTRLFPLYRNYKDFRRHGSDAGGQATAFLGMEERPPKHIRAQFKSEAAKLTTALEWNARSGQPVDAANIQPIFDAWKKWTALEYRATRASKDQGKQFDSRHIAVLYAEFIRNNYSIPVPTDETIRNANDAQISTWKRKMDDTLWAPIKDPVTGLRDNIRKLMLNGWTLEQISQKTGIDVSSYADAIK